jgi:hypothetical protein
VADDEDVVRFLERDALFHDQAPNSRPTVIAQIAMELLYPRLGGKDERDLRFAHLCAAPVARTSVTEPVSSAEAIRAATSG